jgi:hypothetical protein
MAVDSKFKLIVSFADSAEMRDEAAIQLSFSDFNNRP